MVPLVADSFVSAREAAHSARILSDDQESRPFSVVALIRHFPNLPVPQNAILYSPNAVGSSEMAPFTFGSDIGERVTELYTFYRPYVLRQILHDKAEALGYLTYQDPYTNDIIATSKALEGRTAGACNHALERHCPQTHEACLTAQETSPSSSAECVTADRRPLPQVIDTSLPSCNQDNLRLQGRRHLCSASGPSDANSVHGKEATWIPDAALPEGYGRVKYFERRQRPSFKLWRRSSYVMVSTTDIDKLHAQTDVSCSSSDNFPACDEEGAGTRIPAADDGLLDNMDDASSSTFSSSRNSSSSLFGLDGQRLFRQTDGAGWVYTTMAPDANGSVGAGVTAPTYPSTATLDSPGSPVSTTSEWQKELGTIRNGYKHPFSVEELATHERNELVSLPTYALEHQMNIEANRRKKTCYIDPTTGCLQLTSDFLSQLPHCDGEYHPHCPHGDVCHRHIALAGVLSSSTSVCSSSMTSATLNNE